MKNHIPQKKLREFGFLIGFIFPFFIGWILPIIGGHSFRLWTLWVSLPTLIVAILKPLLLFYPYKAWMKIGNILGWLNSNLILGLVFISVLIPISIVMKIIGYDPLKQNFKGKTTDSYRELRRNKVDLTRIF